VDEQAEEFVRVVVDLPEPDEGVSGERLWAVPVGDDVYEIRSSPWHARNINWGDWVKAISPSDDQWPRFVSVVKRSGHRTMHVYFLSENNEEITEALTEINRLGASYENADGKVYAVDCEPEIAVGPIVDYLSQLKTIGAIKFRISEC
jgi:hypothetical protein